MTGLTNNSATTVNSGDTLIDSLLGGEEWADATVEYAFPNSSADYPGDYFLGENTGFVATTNDMQSALRTILDADQGNSANDGFSVEGFTGLNIAPGTDTTAHIRVSITTYDENGYGTAWAYSPGEYTEAGDVWFTNWLFDFTSPSVGEYDYYTAMHEVGHALGLKHGHEVDGNGALPFAYDAMEYTIMTYRSYQGGPTSGLTNDDHSFAQTFMMLDIAALQYMYGADFTTNSGDTTYAWTPGSGVTMVDGATAIPMAQNKIFATIWDGGGTDHYDLSAYTTRVEIDLEPGMYSVFSTTQLAELDFNNPSQLASGNVYNALQYQGDARSLIENATGGSGNDRLQGNSADNLLDGGDGRDQVYGYDGDDTLQGGNDNDKLFGGGDSDDLSGDDGNDKLNGGAGNDVLRGGNDKDTLNGGGGKDTIYAGDGNDLIDGGKSKDRLFGGDGRDTITGGNGGDILTGGGDRDEMEGGAGADTFRFTDATDSQTGWLSDVINDFEIGIDTIDLEGIFAGTLTYLGAAGFTGTAGELRAVVSGGETLVQADIDGDAAADFRIRLTGVTDVIPETDLLL